LKNFKILNFILKANHRLKILIYSLI